MNIDFHFGVIYMVARVSGLAPADAEIVAHSCQYIDDATTNGILKFEEGQTYERFASAHVMWDYRNEFNDQDKLVWAPFHFLPAAEGTTLDEMAVCRPDSVVAREMVRHGIAAREKPNALHRLGVTLHTYVDTWAHQGFSGMRSANNRVTHLMGELHPPELWKSRLEEAIRDAGYTASALALDQVSLLGHGAALAFPDMPFAEWEYTNGNGKTIQRKNLPQFMQAAEMASRAIRGFQHGNLNFETEIGLPDGFQSQLHDFLQSNRDHDGKKRLQVLIEAVKEGRFSAVPEPLPTYIAKGEGSWKWLATGIASADDGGQCPHWSEQFEGSDYRKFHDAVKEHRFVVTQEILPAFGVRLA